MPLEHTIQCDDIQPWLSAYALGEADDEAAAQAHLAACPQCQRDLQQYRLVAGMLPYSAPEIAPPPQLRAQVIAAVEQAAAVSAPARAAAPAKMRPLAPPAQSRRSRSFWAALTFAAMSLALLAWNVSLRRELDQQQAQVALSRQGWQTMIALLNDSSLRWYALGAPAAGAGQTAAQGHFWTVPQGQVACLVAQGLPDLPEGQIYQVWLVHDGAEISAATFEAHDGGAWTLVRTDEPLAQYSGVFVTVEPAGGSSWPAGPRVISGDLAVAQTPTSADRQELMSLLWGARPLHD
jgi:hypothetical protein